MTPDAFGFSTRAVHAGLPPAQDGAPLLPPIVVAAPYHLAGEADASPYNYGRYANPTWTALERALSVLEGGPALVFASGMAAVTAVVTRLRPGEVLVRPSDGYGGTRALDLPGVEVREVATGTAAIVAACEGAALVWVETPSNPLLQVCDIAAVAEAAHAAGALLAVDNTLATPLGQQPLALGADFSVTAGTKSLSGHSDVLLGVVAARDPALAAEVGERRSRTGSIAGPFEAWLAHRSLATLELRLARQSANAVAVARLAEARGLPVWHPSQSEVAAGQMRHFGALVSFDLGTEARARTFLARAALVAEATSFGGVHSTAERRARWGTDAVGPGLVRLSAGIEDEEDLLADVGAALDLALT
jgi:cystathionine gamma-lyase